MVQYEIFFLCVLLCVFYNVELIAGVNPLDDEVSRPIVDTSVGSIQGLRAADGNYSMFMGIPFAEVDKNNVFGLATPYPKFENTFDASDDSAICPQVEEFNRTIVGSLDCLHLNVYVPDSASAETKLPVFVWIYGGGFNIGFAGRFLYGPSYLVSHDIIFVTLNYRIGPYGFMCLDIPEVPGNQGLRDQVLALRWIKENIGAFGGDNAKITIGGNSAGGMSADFLMYYGDDENLFQKIIPQSGVALNAGLVGNADPTTALKLAEYFNYTSGDLKEALSFLSTIDPHEIIAATNEIGVNVGPCVEKEFDGVKHFINKQPVNADIARANDVEILIGFNNDEVYARFFNMPDIVFENSDFVGSSLMSNFDFENKDDLFEEMKKFVTHFYFGDEDINSELKQQAIDISGDFTFVHPTLRAVQKYLDSGVETIYLYLFSYAGGRNFVKHRENITGGGAVHADEVGYLFDISYMEKPLDPADQLIVDRMTLLWANFVKYGNPTPATTDLVPLLWPQVTKDKWHYLELDTNIRVSSRPFNQRMAFLDLLFKANEKYQRGVDRDEQSSSGRNIMLDISLPLLLAAKNFLY